MQDAPRLVLLQACLGPPMVRQGQSKAGVICGSSWANPVKPHANAAPTHVPHKGWAPASHTCVARAKVCQQFLVGISAGVLHRILLLPEQQFEWI